MVLFRMISLVLVLLAALYLYFLLKRCSMLWFRGAFTWRRKLVLAVLALVICVPVRNLFGFWAMVVLHVVGIAAVVDLVRLAVLKVQLRENRIWHVIYCSGLIPVAGTLLILAYGYWNMHHVIKTEYTVTTDKKIRAEGYEAALLTDLHYGTTMGGEALAEVCGRIAESRPDVVILGGDIVDEHTTLEQVQEAFQILSGIDSTYGTFYVYGNHDKGRYSADCDFTERQLEEIITGSGIRILADETCELNPELNITGRRDRSDASMDGIGRAPSGALITAQEDEVYHILADHQPRSFQENDEAGYDLMVSGHTHAGQIWPVGLITTLFDKGTVNYGYEKEGDMDIIVSSGVAGWGYPVRTGKHCEFVIVHVTASSL